MRHFYSTADYWRNVDNLADMLSEVQDQITDLYVRLERLQEQLEQLENG